MNIHMYHQFTHVDLRGMYNGFLIPLWPRAALRACGLSAGFNGFRWIILVGLFPPLTWIKHQYHLFEDIFPHLFAGLLLAHLVVTVCVYVCTCKCACMYVSERYTATAGSSVKNLKESDHWLLHLILGKSKCEKSHLKQYLHHQVGSRMFMKAVCHITCNLCKMNCYFLFLYAPRRGKNAKIILHCTFAATPRRGESQPERGPCRCAQGHWEKWEICVWCTVHP